MSHGVGTSTSLIRHDSCPIQSIRLDAGVFSSGATRKNLAATNRMLYAERFTIHAFTDACANNSSLIMPYGFLVLTGVVATLPATRLQVENQEGSPLDGIKSIPL
jgi:hypothetical protein